MTQESSAYTLGMRRALSLARRAWGHTHPNPMVGAVILEHDHIVAEGWHQQAGGPHAEIAALRALGRKPSPDATLVVTLEPCSTHGRTGPCTSAILESGIRRVVVGATDPNPAHAGRGLALLRDAGIEVLSGILEEECRDLNLIFNHHIVHHRPLLAGKIATTIDGKIATRSGHSRWITGEQSRLDVMHWRALFPAIVVGSRTVIHDDPSLTVRLPNQPEDCPRRLIFDRTLSLLDHPQSKIFTDAFRQRTTLVTSDQVEPSRVEHASKAGLDLWTLPSSSQQVFFQAFSSRCLQEGIVGVYIEGGPHLLSAFLQARSLDYLFAYRSPAFLADEQAPSCFMNQNPLRMDEAFRLRDCQHAQFGDDQLLRGFINFPC